jgi:hypothetical protein
MEGKQPQLPGDVLDSAPHQPLDRVDGAVRRRQQVRAGGVAHHHAAALGHGDHRWNQLRAVLARDHLRRVALHEGDQRIGGAEIDAHHATCLCLCHRHL